MGEIKLMFCSIPSAPQRGSTGNLTMEGSTFLRVWSTPPSAPTPQSNTDATPITKRVPGMRGMGAGKQSMSPDPLDPVQSGSHSFHLCGNPRPGPGLDPTLEGLPQGRVHEEQTR